MYLADCISRSYLCIMDQSFQSYYYVTAIRNGRHCVWSGCELSYGISRICSWELGFGDGSVVLCSIWSGVF